MQKDQLADIRTSLRTFVSQAALQQDMVARKLGLTSNDMKCFRIISAYGPITPGELAGRTGITTGGITKILDHLEHYGAIERKSDAPDRRSISIEAIPLENPELKKAEVDFDRMVSEIMDGYSSDEVKIIKKFLDHTSAILNKTPEA
jgi:DNA-binding MarR family transcriptional regulator